MRSLVLPLLLALLVPTVWASHGGAPLLLTRSAAVLGDVTGDGLDEILSHDEYVPAGREQRLRILDGATGSPLWTLSLFLPREDFTLLLPGDLTGDHAPDVVIVTREPVASSAKRECIDVDATQVACEEEWTAQWTWRLDARHGATGVLAWSVATDGASKTETRLDGLQGESRTIAATYAVVAAGDQDGDGGVDLLASAGHEDDGLAGITVRLLRGADGATLASRSRGAEEGSVGMLPTGPFAPGEPPGFLWYESRPTPDPACDVLLATAGTCVPTNQGLLALEALRGATLATVWRIERDGFAFPPRVEAAGADLDGDGVHELYVRDRDVRALSGANGQELWLRGGAVYHAVGPLDALPGLDLIAHRTFLAPGVYNVTLVRVSGATGQTIFETTHSFPYGTSGWSCTSLSATVAPVRDLDGDGARDASVNLHTEDCSTRNADRTWDVLESSASGAILHARESPTKARLLAFGDLDGDAAEDVLDVQIERPGGARQPTYTARTLGSTGAHWSVAGAAFTSRPLVWTATPAQLAGGLGVVFTEVGHQGSVREGYLHANRGSDGAQLWTS